MSATRAHIARVVPQLGGAIAGRALPIIGNLAFTIMVARQYGAAALGIAGTVQLVVRVSGEAWARGWPTAIVAESISLRSADTWALGHQRLTRLAVSLRSRLVPAGAIVVGAGVAGGLISPAHAVIACSVALGTLAFAAVRINAGLAVALSRPAVSAAADLGLGSALASVGLILAPPFDTAAAAAAWASALFAAGLVVGAVFQARLLRHPGEVRPPPVVRNTTARDRLYIATNAVLTPAVTLLAPLTLNWRAAAADAGAFVGVFRLGVAGPVVLSIISPIYLKRLAARQRRSRLLSLLEAQGVGLAMFLPYALLCLIAPEIVLSLLGGELSGETHLLRLIIIGQALNVATGPTAQTLNVAGRARHDTASQVLALVVAAVAIGLQPPTAEAAAIAIIISQAVRNASALWATWRR